MQKQLWSPPILAHQFELKHSLINMMTTDQFFGLEKDNPHDHIRWFNKITSTIKYKDVPNSAIKLMLFPFSLARAARRWLEKELSQITKLTHAVNQQMSAVTTAMMAILKQFQATPPPASVKAVEETWLLAVVLIRITSGNSGYCPPGMANQIRPPGFDKPNVQNNQYRFDQPQGFNRGNNFNPKQTYQAPTQQNQNIHLNELEKVTRMNEANMKAMQTQIDMVKNKLRNEMKNSIQASLSNQTNEIKKMMASLLQMNIASTSGSGSLPSNTVANPKGELKAITTRSGIVLDGPTVLTPPPIINPDVEERVKETLTDPDLAEDHLHPNIPYPSKMLKQKQQEKDEVQIQIFWQMFKQLHINITLADALILMPKYQKMLKALLSNKEKLQELSNTPLNENCSAVILKKLPEKLGDPGKFLIPCGFSELKCKALADLGASINLMPLSVWKKLDVFVSVGKFTFPPDFVIVDYESDLRVPLILGRPFLRTARALLTFMPSGNPTFSSHPELTSPKVNDDIFDFEGGNVQSEKLLDLDSTKDLHPPLHVNPLSGSTTYFSSSSLLEELADELALITFHSKYDDDLQFDVESNLKEIEFLLQKDIDSSLKDSIDQSNLSNPADIFIDSVPEIFTDEHALGYSPPPIFDECDDDFLEVESDAENVYDDPFDSKGEKIKESKLLIDELDLPCDFLLPFAVMAKYGVTHRLSTAYHPQTSGQVEVTNRGLKRILERTVGENHASWSDKLEDALWAFRTAFKTSIGCTPYRLVYRKACHLPLKLEHKAYWALKHVNFDLKITGDHQKLQLNELNELRNQAYENSFIYKERTKKLHDDKIKNRIFNVGDQVLLFNSRLKIFSGKLKSRWSGPFTISEIYPYGTAKLIHPDGFNFEVNCHRLKHYHGGDPPPLEIPNVNIFPKDN
nr:reverse transcriptase domain-containing protein [Tanacetum cinerariifolium]